MENVEAHNSTYWKTVPPEKIIGRNAFPGEELFKELPEGASILDLGCGTGEMAEFLSERGYQVTGLDINAEAIEQNKARAKHIRYLVGDMTKTLPFENETFDAVVTSFVLGNVIPTAERTRVVAELTRVLKPKGIIWINEPLVSPDYARRYEFSRPFLAEDHDFFVFKEDFSPSSIHGSDDLQHALDEGNVVRSTHHFTSDEFKSLFTGSRVLFEKASETSSPHSRSVIKMAIVVFKKGA